MDTILNVALLGLGRAGQFHLRSMRMASGIRLLHAVDPLESVGLETAQEFGCHWSADPEAALPLIKHAGAVFLGHHTPEALGDYVTGSNHVLPTSRAARFSSGLGLYDFLKRMSVQKASPEGFAALAPAAIRLAEAEGLPAHARSVSVRTNKG